MLPNLKNEPTEQLGNKDSTDEIVGWAKDRTAAAYETTPGKMRHPEGTELEPELDPPASESISSGVEAIARTKLKQQRKIFVVILPESTTDQGEPHLFDESQEASQFMETLMQSGLSPDRVMVFQGTPMDFNVTYRPVVTIDEPEQEPTVAS